MISTVNVSFFVLLCQVMTCVPFVLREKTPTGESIVAIASSDPNVEKYLRQHYPTKSGFGLDNVGLNGIHRSISIAAPGKAIAGNGRNFVSAATGPFQPFFPVPIFEPRGFNHNLYLKDWLRSLKSFHYPSFNGTPNNDIRAVSAINDNGHIYGRVGTVTFDNRA